MPPWERIDGEGDKPYAYFRTYLMQRPPRSVARVSEEHDGVGYPTIRQYSSKYLWKKRAAAWDEEQHMSEDRAIMDERDRIAREQLRQLEQIRAVAGAEIIRIARTAKEKIDADEEVVKFREAVSAIKDVVQLERLIAGEATERVESSSSVNLDISDLSPREREVLIDLLGRAGALTDGE
jgi:hypothetical protein